LEGTVADQPNTTRTRWTIWGALFATIPIYAVVGIIQRNAAGAAPPQETVKIMIPALGALAVFQTILVLFVARKIFASLPFLTFCILRWALSESVAVFGLVLMILGAVPAFAFAFFVWSMMLMILTAPTSSLEESFRPRVDGGTGSKAIEP
jgi:hypothetical protein